MYNTVKMSTAVPSDPNSKKGTSNLERFPKLTLQKTKKSHSSPLLSPLSPPSPWPAASSPSSCCWRCSPRRRRLLHLHEIRRRWSRIRGGVRAWKKVDCRRSPPRSGQPAPSRRRGTRPRRCVRVSQLYPPAVWLFGWPQNLCFREGESGGSAYGSWRISHLRAFRC